MRQLDEFARLWNDTRSRLPLGVWSWPLVAAAAGALIVLVGSGPSEVSTVSNAAVAQESNEASPACEEQTWPYLSDACLQRSRPAGAQSAQTPPSHVRVLNYDAAMARAAVGATPWAPKETARPPQARQKQPGKREATREATHGTDRSKTVTVRSDRRDRNGSRERVYNVPNDAYSAYGYVPRR